MSVEEIFVNPQLGTIVTGYVECGKTCVGDYVTAIDRSGETTRLKVQEIIQNGKSVEWFLCQEDDKQISLRFDLFEANAIKNGSVIVNWKDCPTSPPDWSEWD